MHVFRLQIGERFASERVVQTRGYRVGISHAEWCVGFSIQESSAVNRVVRAIWDTGGSETDGSPLKFDCIQRKSDIRLASN